MNTHIESYDYKGHEISLFYDEDAESPRENCNLGIMVAFHSRYNLGDQDHGISQEEAVEMWEEQSENDFFLPLYLYDHSGLTMKTDRNGWPFTCPWDTSHVGFIYCTKGQALEMYQRQRMTKKLQERVIESLVAEVSEYNDYLTGNAYGYVVERDGEHVDSCWGYIGDPDYVFKEAESFVDHATKEQAGLIY